jgi:hypothetical protein
VGPDAVLEPVEDGPQVQVLGLDVPEVAFEAGEVFVGGHRAGGVEGVRGDRGADDVDPVGERFGVDGGLAAALADPFADVEDEVLGDLALADDLPGRDADLVRVLQPPGGDPGGDLAQVRLGRGQPGQERGCAGSVGRARRAPQDS